MSKICSDFFVMQSGVMFGDLIVFVSRFRVPVSSEFALICTATQPVEAHIHGFGPFWNDFVSDDTQRGGVVGLHWGWRLTMSHRVEEMPHWDCFATVDI